MKHFTIAFALLLITFKSYSQKNKDSLDVHIVRHQFFAGTFFDFSSSADTRTNITSGAYTGTNTLTYGGDIHGGFMLTGKVAFMLKAGYTESQPGTYDFIAGFGNIALQDDDIVYSITPTLRYYKQLNDDNFFLIQARFPVSFGTYSTQTYDTNKKVVTSDTYNKFGLGAFIMPGFSSFISKHIAAEIAAGSFGYSFYNGKDAKGNTTKTSGFDGLLYLNSVSLGFTFYF